MYCPNCGNKSSTDQRFCRSCGLGLEKVAQTLVEQLPTKLDENLEAQKNRLEQWGVAALSVFGLGLLSALLYWIVYKLMITQGNVMTGLAFLGFLVLVGCGLLSVILFAKANEVGEAKNKRRITQPEGPAKSETTRELLPEGRLEQTPSVTEHTTELLFVERKSADKER